MQDQGRVGGRAHGAQISMRGHSVSVSPCTGDSSGSSNAGRKKRSSRRRHSARNIRHGKEPMSLKALAATARGGRRRECEARDANDDGGEQEDTVESEQDKQGKQQKNGLAASKESKSHGAEATEALPQVSTPQETDRMRAALEALKRRRADLDAAQADLEASRKAAASLQAQLDAVKADLEAEKMSKASTAAHSVVQQSQFSALQVELDAALKFKASFKGELEALQQQLKDEQSKAEGEHKVAKALTEKLDSNKSELGTLQQEKEALRLRHAEVQIELDEAHRGRVQMADEAKMLQSKLNATVSESEDLRMANMSLASKADRLQADLNASEAEVEQLKAVRSRERLSGAHAELAPGALLELEVAWESFVGTGLRRLHTALLGAGVRANSNLGASLRTASVASASAALGQAMNLAPAASSTARKDTLDSVARSGETGSGRDRHDKKERKSEKKASKKGRRNGLTFTEPAPPRLERKNEDREALITLTPRSSPQEGSDTSSQEFDDSLDPNRQRKRALLPHRTCRAERPAIRRRRNKPSAASSGRITFAAGASLVSEVSVASYRHCNESLWFTDPQANVFCEGCRRRVPQKRGRLRGAPGHASSFMCDDFVCNECADGEE